MSAEETNESTTSEATGDENLSDALAGEEQSFVTGEQKPAASKTSMIILGLALAGGGLYFFLHNKHSSADLAAADTTTPSAAAADTTINSFLDKGNENLKSMQTMLHNTEKIVEQFKTYPTVTQVPLNDLKTNPFKLNGGSDQDDTNGAKKKEQERQAALKGVQDLHLQSIMSGSRKSCMINNALYTEGQQIESFVVEKITSSSVIVRTGAYRFELKMKK